MKYIAADFGAGSGRVIVGESTPSGIALTEVHRFPNRQITFGGTVHWDFLALFEELKTGLKKAFSKYDDIVSIGIDTWGVDFGLIDRNGSLLANPVCYRDARTAGMLDKAFQSIPKEEFFALTGNQFMEINTLFQLLAMKERGDVALEVADKLLFMPDLFNYYLCGVAANEYTIATTSQMLNPSTQEWDAEVFSRLGLPIGIMQRIAPAGTILGELLPDVAEEVGAPAGIKVVTVGSHDTASAIASISPEVSDGWAFISSGTWSLMGIDTPSPIVTPDALAADFTNEGITNGHISFLRNITGLWLLQNLEQEWKAAGEDYTYTSLIADAEKSTVDSIVDVDAPCFSKPRSMSVAIRDYCKNGGMQVPETKGDFMRVVCMSLAAKYADVKTKLEQCSGQTIDTIYVVGGGSQNVLLNRLTGEKTGCRVVPCEKEATAIGNIMVQMSIQNNSTF